MFARDRYCRWLAAMAIMAALTGGAQAQTAPASERYPERTVRFIVPVSPGALIDSFARVLAAGLQALWGQSVVVENKTGSAGVTGVVAGLQSPPDGYTFVFMGVTSQVIAGAFRDPPPYDPRKDWNPVAITGKCTFVFLVNDQLPVKNLRDMVAYIKARPGQLNYGSGGVGSINHLGMEIFKRTTGTQMTHIPFRGGSEAVIGLTNNSIQVYLTDITAANSAVGMGKSDHHRPARLVALSDGAGRARDVGGGAHAARGVSLGRARCAARRSAGDRREGQSRRQPRPRRPGMEGSRAKARLRRRHRTAVDLQQGHRGQRQSVDARRARDCRRAECEMTGRSGPQASPRRPADLRARFR